MLRGNNRASLVGVSNLSQSTPRTSRLERRAQKRHIALLRVGLLHADGTGDLCVVKNVSASGLSARVYRELAIGEQVQIEFRSGELLNGSVVWARNWDIGIAFSEPIDLDSLLASRWVTEPDRRRNLPRVELSCRGRLSRGVESHGILLQDISQGGARVQVGKPVEPGNVVLSLPDLPPVAGVVRWANSTLAGISFNECISFETLARWIQAQRASRH